MKVTTGTSSLTLHFETGGCNHVFDVALGCEPHDYKHLWGWACSVCWREQVFYPNLDEMCNPTHQDPQP